MRLWKILHSELSDKVGRRWYGITKENGGKEKSRKQKKPSGVVKPIVYNRKWNGRALDEDEARFQKHSWINVVRSAGIASSPRSLKAYIRQRPAVLNIK